MVGVESAHFISNDFLGGGQEFPIQFLCLLYSTLAFPSPYQRSTLDKLLISYLIDFTVNLPNF